MRICVISTPVFRIVGGTLGGYGGLEVIAGQTAAGLAAKGHAVALIAPEGSSCPGCEIIPCGPAGHWNELQAYGAYWQRLPEFDVVIDHTWNKWSYQLKAEGRLPQPILATLHAPVDSMYRIWPPLFPGLPVVEKACPVCISKDQAAHFEALHGHEARVAYNGVDLDFYRCTGEPRTERFLFLARFSAIKGADLALEACYQAGVGLDLVGDTSITNEPDYFARCKAMAERTSPGWDQSKGKQFNVVGGASRGECVSWFSRAHCLLHPNQRFREPFGLAPVEAMACGCPVISWRYGAMKETIPHGDEGFVQDAPGALVSSFDDLMKAVTRFKVFGVAPEQRKNLREWAGHFSVQHMVDRYETLCVEAAKTGGW
jgi:glycosyltransferase involved in cell wall biosynthesis